MDKKNKYDCIKLENQLCFPLYACAKGIVRKYGPFLAELGLTYTQYIAMMVLWDKRKVTVSELGEKLYLDSGTLTPMLKKLEACGYIKRERNAGDERIVDVSLTEDGLDLREKAVSVPSHMKECVCLPHEDYVQLYELLQKVLKKL